MLNVMLPHQRLLVRAPVHAPAAGILSSARRELLGIGPDAVDRRTNRQWLAVAVRDRAAMRGDALGTQVP